MSYSCSFLSMISLYIYTIKCRNCKKGDSEISIHEDIIYFFIKNSNILLGNFYLII